MTIGEDSTRDFVDRGKKANQSRFHLLGRRFKMGILDGGDP